MAPSRAWIATWICATRFRRSRCNGPATGVRESPRSCVIAAGRLVEIWNQLANVRKVAKFTNRNTGVQRLWQALEGEGELKRHTRRVTAKQRGLNKPARSRPKTKTERMLALLDRPEGVSLQTLMKTTQWQAHSVRGFLSAQVTKRMGLKVNSFRREGQRVYAIDR